MKRMLLLVVSTAVLVGCASAGNQQLKAETEQSVAAKLTEGKSTKSDVRALYGSPLKTSFTDSGLEIWSYELTKMHADAVNFIPVVNLFGSSASGSKKELIVLFDNEGKVKKYSMSESAIQEKTGLFQ